MSRVNRHTLLHELMAREGALTTGRSHLIVTPNMHHLALMERSDALAAAYRDASLTLADGWPVVRLANFLGGGIEGRLTGSELVKWLAESTGSGRRVYLVGGSSERSLADAAAHFADHGWLVESNQAPAGWLDDPAHLIELRDAIERQDSDIVIVGLGTPKQEIVAQQLQRGTTTAVFLCVGAGIDFLSGEKRRAPHWMQRTGLEWFHRILTEPGRLARRYASDVPAFARVIRKSVARAPAKPTVQPIA